MQNHKKILIFSTAYYPFVGGAEVAIKGITDRIPGMEFDLITAKLQKNLPFREKIRNVTVYRLGIGIPIIDKLIAPFEAALFARHLMKRNEYSYFWCMMASFVPGGAYLKNIFSKKKVPVILTLQEGDSEKYLRTKWLGLIDLSWRLALKQTRVLTVISNYLGERARKLGYKGEVKLIPNGVDIGKFSKEITEEEKIRIRRELGLAEGDVALVTSSRLNVKNGIGDVIESLTKLPQNIKFIIFGTGELENELKSLTKKLNLEGRVMFKGFVSHEDLPKYLKAADIFIRPSLSEGQGISFLEAMAARIPVIATPVGGIVDFLKGGETGYFCKPEDPQSIADTVTKVMTDSNKNLVLETAYRMAVEKYDWEKISLRMKEIFDNMSK